MKDAIVLGIITGAVWGVLAIGLVLVYKGSRIFNFAQGEFGTVAAFVAWMLISNQGWPYWLGALLAVTAGGAMGFLTERLVVRPLFDAPRVTLLVATGGVALMAVQLERLIGGLELRSVGPAIRGNAVPILGVPITPQELLIVVVLGAMGLGLVAFFSRTRTGAAILAASEDALAAELIGISSRKVSTILWTLAGVIGGAAGMLLIGAPGQAVFPGVITQNALLAGFTAAVIGGMDSIPGAFVGGIGIGVAQQVGLFYLLGTIPSPDMVILMSLLLIVLLIRPQGILGKKVQA